MEKQLYFNKAGWIWEESNCPDRFIVFRETFFVSENDSADWTLHISCANNYIVSLNGQVIFWGQYSDYPFYKVGDKLYLNNNLIQGNNTIEIMVWYYGEPFQTSYETDPGVIYEVFRNGSTEVFSSVNSEYAVSEEYAQGRKEVITLAIGFSYCYDFRGKDKKHEYRKAKPAPTQFFPIYERPNKKVEVSEYVKANLIDPEKRIYDLGKECCGHLYIDCRYPSGKEFSVAFGEYLNDKGNVLYRYDGHKFSVGYIGNGKRSRNIGYFRRLGCRYLQILSDLQADIYEIGIYQTDYPVKEYPVHIESLKERKIYDTAVRTLRLCMHEHYEDCPWREQSLYILDSRTQMLCGYYAFREFDFARSNLLLMSKAGLKNGFLPKCFPSADQMPIPVYSLVYVIQMQEYLQYSNDSEFVKERLLLLEQIINSIEKLADSAGLVNRIPYCWNFYEWSDGLTGLTEECTEDTKWNEQMKLYSLEKECDLPLNCFRILALSAMDKIYEKLGLPLSFSQDILKIRKAVFDKFFEKDKVIFRSFANKEHYSRLCNSLAVLAGCAFGYAEEIAEKLVENKGFTDISLAMKPFYYDALISIDTEKYKNIIISDIDKDFLYMLSKGATSFWETMRGYHEYGGAGSLCHGWSAFPVYYYHKLGVVKEKH